ncbi:MAG: hypothetical protein IJD79_02925 [Clostridia bacterium]|nr:hypothetical protein [Clostridia bacterium]
MKRNAKNNTRKISLVLCLAMTLVLLVGSVFAITASAEEKSGTISFASTAQRESLTTAKQVWKNDGITFTHNKGSGSNIVDYSNPVRIYANSSIVFNAPGNITKIEVTASSSSYANVLQSSVGNEATVSGSKVTITPTTLSDTYTVAKITAQTRFNSLTVYYEVAASACAHENTTETTTNATCTEDGITTVTCNDCGEVVSSNVTAEATGHQNTTEATTDSTCSEAGSTTVTCNDCGKVVSTTPIDLKDHCFFDGVCHVCDAVANTESGYQLLTDINNLKVGDKIIIAANAFNYAISTTQNNNNRGQASITKSGSKVTFETDVQVLTVEEGTIAGTFAFNTGSGYLYAASSGSNYLKTETTKSANSSWKITISADDTASIVAQGSNSRNIMQYNSTSSLFSCYASATQKPLSIYKEFKADNPYSSVKISGAQVSLGESLAIKYYVTLCEHLNASDFAMSFTMNDTTVDVTECVKADDGRYVFTFSGIAPQCMGDNVSATVISNGEAVAALDTYSVKANLVSLLEKNPSDELKTLIYDTLTYGAAAQVYRNHNTDNLVTKDVAGLTASENAPAVDEAKVEASTSENVSFKSAGVHFSAVNKIYVKFTATTLEGVKLLAGDKELTVEHVSGNVYIAYTDALNATELNSAITFSLSENGESVQTLTYSVAHYAAAKWNNTEADGETLTAMADLARALYRYGVSAYEYAN